MFCFVLFCFFTPIAEAAETTWCKEDCCRAAHAPAQCLEPRANGKAKEKSKKNNNKNKYKNIK